MFLVRVGRYVAIKVFIYFVEVFYIFFLGICMFLGSVDFLRIRFW